MPLLLKSKIKSKKVFDTENYLAKMAASSEVMQVAKKSCSLKIRTYQSVWALVDDNPIRSLGFKLGFNETK
ncbi:hypothetical protein VspSTUT11_02820 [Vibrio sp. STUT-A11]|nr:hypothetical protein VspSTUT11_02820 [Vibrio sp. STUT-A11]